VAAADVTVLVDTFVDVLMASTHVARRAPLVYEWSEGDQLRAEHGYALLLTVQRGGQAQSILYDAGLGRDTAVYNMDVLQIRPANLRAVVLSHGHADHHSGLEAMFRRLGRPGMPLVLHPDAWRERRIVFPTGTEIHMPPPSPADLAVEGVEVVEERGPSLLLATSCSTSSSASLEADDRPSRTSQPQSRTKMRQSRRSDTDDHDALRLMLAIAAAHKPGRLLAPHRA
jgi:7,8-dihydropterin-6-yl-methyl-4-(beta-D-ribofuranosyl)aminobenzene 5'-phosphate synthase